MNQKSNNKTNLFTDSLPKDWDVKPLKELITFNLGRTPKRKEEKYWINGEIPWVSISDMVKFNTIYETKELISREALHSVFKNKLSKKGTLLMSFKLTIGRTSLLGIDATHNEAIISIYPRESISKCFLLYYLPIVNYQNYMDRAIKGNTLNKSKIEKILVPLPSINEQKGIVKILNSIKKAKEQTVNVISSVKYYKKSLLHHLFTYGPVPLDQRDAVELQETAIGLLPKEWIVKKLGKIASMKSGGTPSRKNTMYWNGDIPWVKTGEINYTLILAAEEKITAEGLENSSARIIPKGTLLIAMYGQGITRGRVGILGIDASINQACGAIFPSKEVLTEYLFFYLSHIYHEIRSLGHGANQRNLNSNIVKSLDIPIPSLAQQKSIVEILRVVDKKVDAENNKKTALEELFRTLLGKLMTGQIRVNDLNLEEIQT